MNRPMALWITLLAGIFAAGGPAAGVDTRLEPFLEVVPDEIVGVALYPDGQTPVAELPIRVWNEDQSRMVYRTRTAADGTFRVPRSAVGKFLLFVGRVKMNLRMLSLGTGGTYQHQDIVVVVPRSMILSGSGPLSITPFAADILIAPFLIKPPPRQKIVSP